MRAALAIILFSLSATACGGNDTSSGTGGTSSGGTTATGGTSAGGTSSGGTSAGGSSSGGTSAGGSSSGGTSAGGSAGTSAGGSGGGATDGGSNCFANPEQDSQCGNGKPPHFYACTYQYTQPAGCVLLNIGNATDTYCCP